MNYENDADVWGPHFWFVLLTVALNYPQETPPDGIRRRNYDFVQSLPLFLPDPHMGDNFAHIINEYPVSPYLDSRHHFVQWVNFIHNKINHVTNKPQMSLEVALKQYNDQYEAVRCRKYAGFHITMPFPFFYCVELTEYQLIFLFCLFCCILYYCFFSHLK